MDIKILGFFPDIKGTRQGFIDFVVTYSSDKAEIFRQVAFFEKDTKRWLSVGAVEREGKWLPKYERTPSMHNMFHKVINALEEHLNKNVE